MTKPIRSTLTLRTNVYLVNGKGDEKTFYNRSFARHFSLLLHKNPSRHVFHCVCVSSLYFFIRSEITMRLKFPPLPGENWGTASGVALKPMCLGFMQSWYIYFKGEKITVHLGVWFFSYLFENGYIWCSDKYLPEKGVGGVSTLRRLSSQMSLSISRISV